MSLSKFEKQGCDPCDYVAPSENAYKQHMTSVTHAKNIGKLEEFIENCVYKCDPCKYYVNEQYKFNRHLKSDRHITAVSEGEYEDKTEDEELSKNRKILLNKIRKYFQESFENKELTFDQNWKIIETKILKDMSDLNLEILYDYNCDKCNYHTNSKDLWNDHIKTFKHLNSEDDNKKFIRDKLETSDKLETYFTNIYKEFKEQKEIEDVKDISGTGSKFDIIIKFHNEKFYRGIQVKTFSYSRNQHCITLSKMKNKDNKYPDDTLIISSNKDHKTFIMFPYKVVKNKATVSMTYKPGTIYYQYFYSDFEQFKKELLKQSKTTTVIENILNTMTPQQKQEYEHLERLKNKSVKKNKKFKKNLSSYSVIDCFINDKKIQCKTSSSTTKVCFNFYLCKNSEGGIKNCPYNVTDDIDFFIFEIVTDKYKNNFYIIPKHILAEKGYLTTSKNKGKSSISIAPPDYDSDHWTLEYLNKFNLIQ